MSNLLKKIATKGQLQAGEVALVGSGPGDPELLTIKVLRFIEQAEVAIYDRLVSDDIMALLPDNCEKIYVGKEQAKHCVPQKKINEILAEQALKGKRVLRLKGGDPFVFGRGGEEAEYLLAKGISCHVANGITAASACTTYAGIPLTHRGVAQGCSFITGHLQNDGQLNLPWQSLSNDCQTVIFYMGINSLPIISQKLIEHGRDKNTPAALIRNGTRENQEVYRGTLANLPQLVIKHNITPPALIVLGKVVDQFNTQNIGQSGYLKSLVTKKTGEVNNLVANEVTE
ncbi:uroporphyrinogen-III C-methyltransferase [Pseudoalteromonas denitrificans]|uniref:uroporphyrinogen-III C-methyltransferase n=1 Tax=Pseudoalteromonas denitrificans DSM 6059 TaxID=1123010 RepID=A0A1I1MSZ1_9GAMM|nr:uroporphyrinogen-III C-methyltransferase [Pseudoalteromonas denitrificans]SFC88246.1 uroporphyrinogen-III C-methyltransferase [Pseudoalteromonas denitrificans DSM 6059]